MDPVGPKICLLLWLAFKMCEILFELDCSFKAFYDLLTLCSSSTAFVSIIKVGQSLLKAHFLFLCFFSFYSSYPNCIFKWENIFLYTLYSNKG